MYAFNLSLFYAIYSLAGRSAWLDTAILVIGQYFLYPIILAVAFFAYREWHAGRMHAMWGYVAAVLGALVARFGVATLIRMFYEHPRPFIALDIPHILTDTSNSFPSGHTIFIFALAAGVYRINKTFAYWLGALGLLIGLARVAGGVHYPFDILSGIVLGILTGWGVVRLWKMVSRYIALPSLDR